MEGSKKLEQGGSTSEHIQVIAMDAILNCNLIHFKFHPR